MTVSAKRWIEAKRVNAGRWLFEITAPEPAFPCVACGGTGTSSRGSTCVPCKGTGKKSTNGRDH